MRDRVPPVDLLVAAIADRHRLGILHYDRDYDLLAEKTDLDIESVPRRSGSYLPHPPSSARSEMTSYAFTSG
jgi:hypothetical protein